MGEVLSVRELSKTYELKKSVFSIRSSKIRALDKVSLKVNEHETLGIVGESGSGKSTLARCVLLLERPDLGEIHFCGVDLLKLKEKELKPLRRWMQIVFQDPYSSLNPRKRVIDIVSEPILNFNLVDKGTVREKVKDILLSVGLDESFVDKYPHEMSGGQRQRVAIARAICTEPSLLVADEPVSSLDVSIQAQILSLFLKIKEERKLSMIFISHDLNVIRFISERVMVMFKGKIVEEGEKEEIFSNPLHPYTRLLLDYSIRGRGRIRGDEDKEGACVYYGRCEWRGKRCANEAPLLYGTENHRVACFLEGTY